MNDWQTIDLMPKRFVDIAPDKFLGMSAEERERFESFTIVPPGLGSTAAQGFGFIRGTLKVPVYDLGVFDGPQR